MPYCRWNVSTKVACDAMMLRASNDKTQSAQNQQTERLFTYTVLMETLLAFQKRIRKSFPLDHLHQRRRRQIRSFGVALVVSGSDGFLKKLLKPRAVSGHLVSSQDVIGCDESLDKAQ